MNYKMLRLLNIFFVLLYIFLIIRPDHKGFSRPRIENQFNDARASSRPVNFLN